MTPATVIASSLRAMSAIFLPTMPYSRTSAVTCNHGHVHPAEADAPMPGGPPTNELTDPYVAMGGHGQHEAAQAAVADEVLVTKPLPSDALCVRWRTTTLSPTANARGTARRGRARRGYPSRPSSSVQRKSANTNRASTMAAMTAATHVPMHPAIIHQRRAEQLDAEASRARTRPSRATPPR